jgi:hypothetical protein
MHTMKTLNESKRDCMVREVDVTETTRRKNEGLKAPNKPRSELSELEIYLQETPGERKVRPLI